MLTVPKLTLSVVIVGALVAGFTIRPPSEAVPLSELKRLVAVITALYLVGCAALLEHRDVLAAIVVAAGLLLCALAVWLSRGRTRPGEDTDDGDGGEPPPEPEPPTPELLWAYYEDQFEEGRLWSDKPSEPVS